ncbi:hypothetical protein LCGC14_0975220 [marine sediment metagenome]|uniref:Uncharacterized protein n=1 Tax=marine sediment metagenome TaxID=412755 RepID=A0A0F9QTQ8_9ZZZZ
MRLSPEPNVRGLKVASAPATTSLRTDIYPKEATTPASGLLVSLGAIPGTPLSKGVPILIRALFKFAKDIPRDAIVIDTTSSSGTFRGLSPFVLSAPPAKRFENLWQFSKVYKGQVAADGLPTPSWFEWRARGWEDPRAHRYPMGKGAVPEYAYWEGKKLDYITARREIYIPQYANNVRETDSFAALQDVFFESISTDRELILLDYDAYAPPQDGPCLCLDWFIRGEGYTPENLHPPSASSW